MIKDQFSKRNIYVCPRCKSALKSDKCIQCDFTILWNDSIPTFFTNSTLSKRYKKIGAFYDELYGTIDNVWKNLAMRGDEFNQFISSLVDAKQPTRYLDIGCGEGFLLAAMTAPQKFGMDISHKALRAASLSADADLCIGFSEEMPYNTGYFDVATSIGVMTHFIDDFTATLEIYRILRPGGCYIIGIFVPLSFIERLTVKVSEFVSPRLKPMDFLRWVTRKVSQIIRVRYRNKDEHKERQPVENYYTSEKLEEIFERVGFVISRVITKCNNPNAPLAGHHFRIYILEKQ